MEQGKKLWLREGSLLGRRRPLAAVHGEYPLLGPGRAEVPNAHARFQPQDDASYEQAARAETAREERTSDRRRAEL